jgi:hypothetical protein
MKKGQAIPLSHEPNHERRISLFINVKIYVTLIYLLTIKNNVFLYSLVSFTVIKLKNICAIFTLKNTYFCCIYLTTSPQAIYFISQMLWDKL